MRTLQERFADIKADIENGTVEYRESEGKKKRPSDRRKHLPETSKEPITNLASRCMIQMQFCGSFRSFLRALFQPPSQDAEVCWVGLQKNDRPADDVFVGPLPRSSRAFFWVPPPPGPPTDNMTAAFN